MGDLACEHAARRPRAGGGGRRCTRGLPAAQWLPSLDESLENRIGFEDQQQELPEGLYGDVVVVATSAELRP